MALSATFTANFASFYDAVDKAEAKLKDFGAGADKVGTRLNTLANQFSGQKIVQEATIMAKAVEEIGGVSKLTEKELARLGATTNEAVAKMKALGMEVPKNLQQIADQTKHANQTTTDWLGTITKVAGAVGIAFSVGAVTNFIGSIFSAASAIGDLADQWGISTKAVQQFTGAAKQSGVEIEKVGRSIQFLTEQLAEGSANYRALLANVGLSLDELRQLSREDAYREVITAIAAIEDQTLQLDVAIGLLGPSARQMIGAIRDGFIDAAEAQKFMADETITRLKAAEAQWGKFKDAVVMYSGEMLGAVMDGVSRMTSSWSNFFGTLGRGARDYVTSGGNLAATLKTAQETLDDYGKKAKNAGQNITLLASAETKLTTDVKNTAQVLEQVKVKEEGLTTAIAARTKTTVAATPVQEAYNKTLEAHERSVNDLMNTFSGKDVIGKANLYLDALKMSIPIQDMTRQQQTAINKVMNDAIAVYQAAGQMAPKVMYDISEATTQASAATEDYWEAVSKTWKLPPVSAGGIDLGQLGTPVTLPPPPKVPAGMFDGMGKELGAAISSSVLKAIQGGGSILSAAGSEIGMFMLDPKKSGLGKSIEAATSKLPGFLGGAINAALPVVGSLIGPAVSWLGSKIAGLFGKKEHEKLRDSFVQAAGGIAPLTKAAQEAGISLDQLMRGRNTDQVKAAIGTIQAALESEKLRKAFIDASGGFDALMAAAERAGIEIDDLLAAKTSDEVTKAIKEIEDALKFQEDAYQLAIDTAKKYGFTLEELGPAMARQELDKQAQQLFQDWEVLNAAGIDTVAITEHMAEAVNEYVRQASAMGTEVPEAMRPMLEAMVESGQLLDENGMAITDLEDAGISFAMTMSEGFTRLIDEVGKLTDAISRSLGLAIEEIPQPEIRGRVSWDVDEVPAAPAGEPIESYQTGTGGFKNFGTGTPVMLHGWEAVVPRNEASSTLATMTSPAGAPAGALAPTIVINAQGAFFDTPESLQRLATKVSEALTAKYSVMSKSRAAV